MNRADLRTKASTRRSSVEPIGPLDRIIWRCNHCSREFQQEKAFMNHSCKEKKRIDELRSPTGQAAYAYYSEWMRLQRYTVPPIETFAESKFYGQFIRFATHAVKSNLPDVNEFIRLMVENSKVPPMLWCRDNVYAMYLKAYDAAVNPEKQFLRAIDLLLDYANTLNVSIGDVFEAIGVEMLYDLIGKRRLTFWSLLASDRFKQWLMKLPIEQRDLLASALNVPAALERFAQEPYLIKQFGTGMREIGL